MTDIEGVAVENYEVLVVAPGGVVMALVGFVYEGGSLSADGVGEDLGVMAVTLVTF